MKAATSPIWPLVIGIISVSFAGLGLLCGFAGTILTLFASGGITQVAQSAGPAVPVPPLETYINMPLITRLALEPVVNGLLLIAGIFLLKRRAVASRLHLAYALISIPYVAFFTWSTWATTTDQIAWMQQEAAVQNQQFAAQLRQQAQLSQSMLPFAVTATLLFVAAYPAFCAVWFGVVRRNQALTAEQPEFSRV